MLRRAKRIAARYLDAIANTAALMRDTRDYLHTVQYEQEREQIDPSRLTRHGYKVFSQSDEDGMIAEIFRRIGAPNKTFFEFGAGDGAENNTLLLLLQDWRGRWIECGESNLAKIRKSHAADIQSGRLEVLDTFVTRDNINDLTPTDELDFVSIDIDGNDFWAWKAMQAKPRVVCIEYNAKLRPPLSLTVKYDPTFAWDGTAYMGASLKALEKLGIEKGYALVGCNYTGNNAFFVRTDLLGNHFLAPYTAENHYEPPRYLTLRAGHPAGVGEWVRV